MFSAPTPAGGRTSFQRRLEAFIPVALFLVIFGVKASVIDRFGTDLPYWDQWPGEGTVTFLPWLDHHDFWGPLMIPHNEHRIAPTRIVSLGLLLADGQWDARVECLVNAALHAGIVVLFFGWLKRRVTVGWAVAIASVFAASFAPPIPWEDVLGGFQSEFYFLTLFSAMAMWGMLSDRIASIRWWAGFLCGWIAIFTMGSGFLCGVPIIAIAGLRLIAERRNVANVITAFAGMLIVGVGAALYSPVAHHAELKAKSLGEFLGFAAKCLSWPCPQWPWLWVVFWLPWAALVVSRLKNVKRSAHDSDLLIAVGGWILIQTAALCYSRGGAGGIPSARYGDITGLGLVLGFVTIAVRAADFRTQAPRFVGIIYAATAAIALTVGTVEVYHTALPRKKQENQEYERNIRAYLITDDFSYLKDRLIPFPMPGWLRDSVLHVPKLRERLPVSVRVPLPLPELTESDSGLPNRRIHTIANASHWESRPLPISRGWWAIETKGDLGKPGASLVLATPDGTVIGRVAATKVPGSSWRTAYVRAPRGPAVLVAETDASSAFAFSEPVEMSALSYWYWQLGKQGTWIALAGGLTLLGIAAMTGTSRFFR